jgi:hypothetical protein
MLTLGDALRLTAAASFACARMRVVKSPPKAGLFDSCSVRKKCPDPTQVVKVATPVGLLPVTPPKRFEGNRQ